MKYLKLFENHNFYTEITEFEFAEATQYDEYHADWETSNWVDFSQDEVDIIKGMLKNNFVFVGLDTPEVNIKTNGIICVSDREYFNVKNWSGTLFYVIKLPDEWYYAVDYSTQVPYKCDQFTGLLKLIEDEFLS